MKKVTRRKKTHKLIPIIGSIVLFLSWGFQSTILDESNSMIRKIDNAQAVYQTYQSNNAIFNALVELVGEDESAILQIRTSQVNNYQYGLRDMENLLSDEERVDIPKPINPFSGGLEIDEMLANTQERLELIQGKLLAKRNSLSERNSTFNNIFMSLYALGSLMVLGGSVMNVISSESAGEVAENKN